MLREIRLNKEKVTDCNRHPFSVPIIKNFQSLNIRERVCFFVGENGSGKSTVLEAIADHCGYGREGGSKNIFHTTTEADRSSVDQLSSSIILSWDKKILQGYFLRAESFFNIATFLEAMPESLASYGGKSLHHQSHGESFLALFKNRFSEAGFYLLDEPEAALSPTAQLSLLLLIRELVLKTDSQFIIATHSPILTASPGAQIFSFDGNEITETKYQETNLYQLYKGFMSNPELYLKKLFD